MYVMHKYTSWLKLTSCTIYKHYARKFPSPGMINGKSRMILNEIVVEREMWVSYRTLHSLQ